MSKMAILIDRNTRVIVQNITGSQGTFHSKLMLDYGTKIVAGVTPGKGKSSVNGVPVYDTVREATEEHNATASIIFVPAPFAKEAVLEAIDSRLNPIVVITEGIPIKDSIEMLAIAKETKISIIGPNTPGIITPGECKLGIMPGHVFEKGKVGLISRSGTLTYEIASGLTKSKLGETTCIGIGGDPIIGLDFIDLLKMFREDRATEGIALIGEIGGDAEEKVAEYVKSSSYPKPIVAYVAGKAAPPGRRMGHAGAIITGKSGTAQSKIEALQAAGVRVAEKPSDVAQNLVKLLSK